MATNLYFRILVAAFFGALFALGFLSSGARGAVQEEVDESAGKAPHVAGELLVVYESGIDAATAEELPEEAEGKVEEEIPNLDTQVVEFPEVKDNTAEEQRERLLQQKKKELEEDPAVEAVDYNYIYEAAYTPNDPRFGAQYGLKKIKASEAWNKTRGRGVDIAVVDTGISNSHPDLRQRISAQANCIGGSSGDTGCTGGPGSAEDDNGHGTKVAGVAAAVTGNDEGIAGACAGCRLLVAKSLKANFTGTTSDVAKGIDWSTQNGAEVINLSLGGRDADSTVMKRAINRARQEGVVVVAAAGNFGNGSGRVYPAAYDNVIAVAATNRNDRRASFSSTGQWVDVAAPGVGILSTERFARYGGSNGTSLSSSFVAGTAGLLAAQGRSANEIRRRINSTAVDLGPRGRDKFYGHGLVDAAAAVGVRNTRPRIKNLRPAPGSRTRDRTPGISAIVRDRETNLKKSNLTLLLDRRKVSFKYDANRDRLSHTSKRKLAPGSHSVKVIARDGQGLRKTREWTFRVEGRKPTGNGPLSMIQAPGYPFNILPDDPIFDLVRN